MADTVDAGTRSRMMAAVRSRDTGPELALRKALHRRGVRGYRVHRRDVLGTPDLAWLGARLAVFVDGAFWHGHLSAFAPGKSGAFWDRKIAANQQRDRRVDSGLRAEGWTVIRFWDFEINSDIEACVDVVERGLAESRGDRS